MFAGELRVTSKTNEWGKLYWIATFVYYPGIKGIGNTVDEAIKDAKANLISYFNNK